MDRVDYESLVIQDLEGMHKRDELDLAPWYQRRSVWTTIQKAYLVNSLFENAPIPTCYIRHYLDVESEKSVKEVVDGQQRIRAILEYLDGEFAAPPESGGPRLKFSELTGAARSQFRMKKISVGYLINAGDDDVIDIFGRLNSVSKTLNDQEKRNAKYSGAMKQFCLKLAASYVNFWRETKLFSATEISRMAEVQFVSDLTLNLMNGLSDFSQPRMNKFYSEFEEDFSKAGQVKRRFDNVMEKLMGVQTLLADSAFTRSPIFFSLFLVMDENRVARPKLIRLISKIDSVFASIEEEASTAADKEDMAFYTACSSSTQRIRSRQIRHKYLLDNLS